MAIINKTGITDGGTIQAEHVTRAIDALSGGSTDTIIATGSLLGTASFATTASYALNAAGSGTQYVTLTFFHSPVTNTSNGRVSYIGGYSSAPRTDSADRIGLVVPFNGTITNGSVTSYASTTDTATVDCEFYINGVSTGTPIGTGLDLNEYVDKKYNTFNEAVSEGDTITIVLTEASTTSAVWNINASLIIKST
jgi:hypothetical protein